MSSDLKSNLNTLPPEERVIFALRALYERYDYRPYRMSEFEEYSLYAENRSFLQSPRVIAFTDLDGRMMALKPDVTLSIVRHAQAVPCTAEKLYYTENVFRPSAASQTFKEISQIGVEAIGLIDRYQTAEIVALSAMSLEAISPDYLIEISHMRFTVGLLTALGISGDARTRALSALSAKNMSELRQAAAQACLAPADTATLLQLPTLYGEVEPTLCKARALCRSEEMHEALDELCAVLGAAGSCAADGKLQLDFSIAGDTDYYNGLMLRGYISGLPRAVLLGGRYDNILHKLGKSGGGIGFAIDLSEIARLPGERPKADTDLLILYRESDDLASLMASVAKAAKKGLRVRALPENQQIEASPNARRVYLSDLTDEEFPAEGGGDVC
ncbi:MAG: ATP phosphoribosyltransferase regulatory subunit [Clostridia bacterium]|nr:ATP phosphoribosyltransferase regulatory subunit [Clostridia bacterium]